MRNTQDVVLWLNRFGYLADNWCPRSSELKDAIKDMQKTYGLKQDARVGPLTNRAMSLFRCGVSDVKAIRVDGTGDCKWEKSSLAYYHSSNFRFPNLSTTVSQRIVKEAWALWTQHIPLEISRTSYSSRADIVVATGRGRNYGFDGVGNVLAWAELPCASQDTRLLTMFDQDEPWTDKQRAAGVYTLAVAAHEFGHIIGLDHSRKSGDLMAPYYNPAVYAPQKGDVRRVQTYYGKPDDGPYIVDVAGKMTIEPDGAHIDLSFV